MKELFKTMRVGVIILLALFFISFWPENINASTTYFQDNFNDNDISDWIVARNMQWSDPSSPCLYQSIPATWKAENGRTGIKIDGPGCVTELVPNNFNLSDGLGYSYSFDMEFTSTVTADRNVVFKYLDPSNWYDLKFYDSTMWFQKLVGSYYRVESTSYPFQGNQTYHFRIESSDNIIKVFINDVQVWGIADSSPYFSGGTIGFQASVGADPDSEVWYDNVVVRSLDPTPTPTPTPDPTIGPFELPVSYEGRVATVAATFKTIFWNRLTAAFDHVFKTGIFRPFTANTYLKSDCPAGVYGISCYDSHNGTDFSKTGGTEVYSVSNGTVAFTSNHTSDACTPNKGGFGCVVIVQYPNNLYGLYAHLSKIMVDTGNSVSNTSQLGVMGNTGCPSCGVHLHLGVLTPSPSQSIKLDKRNWEELLFAIRPANTPEFKPFCSYRAPNGTRFYFQDPSGWKGLDIDPWSKIVKDGGCGITSPYLWKYNIGISP